MITHKVIEKGILAYTQTFLNSSNAKERVICVSEQEWCEHFADNLQTLMTEYGYSQRDLADEIGISESTISRYLRAQQIPKGTILLNIAYALDCSVDDLVDFNERVIL